MQHYIVKTDYPGEWTKHYQQYYPAPQEGADKKRESCLYFVLPEEQLTAFLEEASHVSGNFGISRKCSFEAYDEQARMEADYASMQDFFPGSVGEHVHFYTSKSCGRLNERVRVISLAVKDSDPHVAQYMLNHLMKDLQDGSYNIRHVLYVMLALEVQILGKNDKTRCVECAAKNTTPDCVLRQSTEMYMQFGDIDVLYDQLRQELNGHIQEHLRSTGAVSNEVVQAMVEYINENYYKNISLKQLSEKFYLNPGYICRIFKRDVGLSLSNYLVQLRIRHACRMLRHSQMTVSEIAQRCGYSDYFYFARQFKRMMNVTPTQYRNESRQAASAN